MLLFPVFPLLLLLLLLLFLLFWGGHWVWEFCAVLPDWFPELVLPEAVLVEVEEQVGSLLTLAGLVGSYAGKAVERRCWAPDLASSACRSQKCWSKRRAWSQSTVNSDGLPTSANWSLMQLHNPWSNNELSAVSL